MKKNIVFVVDSFDKYPSANGLCVESLTRCFDKTKYDLFIFCKRFGIGDKSWSKGGVTVVKTFYGFEDLLFGKHGAPYRVASKIVGKIRHVLFFRKWPINSPAFSRKVSKKISLLNFQPDLLIAVSRFCDSLSIVSSFPGKKVSLNLDVLLDDSKDNQEEKYSRKMLAFMQANYPSFDSSIFMDYHRPWVEKYGKQLRIKNPFYTGLPFFEEVWKEDLPVIPKTVMYAGTDSYLNVSSYINLLRALPDYSFDHYGPITNKKNLNALRAYPNFRYRGFVPKNVIKQQLQQHDILVSFESELRFSISSKVFTYVSTGRPLICFCSKAKKEYFVSIGLTNLIFLDYSTSPKGIREALKKHNNRQGSFDFQKFTPESCASVILDTLETA